MTAELINIHGQDYKVFDSRTVDETEAQGLPNTAQEMRVHHVVRHVYMTKPAGQKVFWAYEFEAGYEQWSIPQGIPGARVSN